MTLQRENNSFEACVIRINPGASYQGRAYDYDVGLRLDNGIEITLFDYKMYTDPTMVGKRVRVSAKVFGGQIERIDQQICGTVPDLSAAGKSAYFLGSVYSISKWQFNPKSDGGRLDIEFCLDFCHGRINVDCTIWTNDPTSPLGGRALNVGDFVRVEPGRLDLVSIKVIY